MRAVLGDLRLEPALIPTERREERGERERERERRELS